MNNMDLREFIIIILISFLFFIITCFNLGYRNMPQSGWAINGQDDLYIDLGGEKNVTEMCLLLKIGEINFNVYSGQPGLWNEEGYFTVKDYYRWKKIEINRPISFLKIEFSKSYGEILEIIITEDDKIVKNIKLNRENGNKNSLSPLVDEQEKVSIPLNYMSESIFDEVYYVRTAEDYLSGREPFEKTHPPLGKLMISMGISVFGFNPFGWRIMGVLFATFMLPIMYFLGKEIIGSWLGGLFSSVLLMLDFMHFTMGRIATIDTFLVFFLLLSQMFFYKYVKKVIENGWETSLKYYLVSIIFLSLGFSVKWTAMFTLLSYFFYLGILRFSLSLENSEFKDKFVLKNIKIVYASILTILICVVVYLLVYIPYINIGYSFTDVYKEQLFMLNYHSELKATHPFSSPWWSWPLLIRPVWLYVSEIENFYVSTISLMGNPLIWWFGLFSIISILQRALKEKNIPYAYIIIVFLFQWIPYALISRTLFLYHFYPNIIIICLSASIKINEIWQYSKGRKKTLIYFSITLIIFCLFYPVISGYNAPIWYRKLLYFFPSWVF
jgi:dolichyl-phosphate-mannose-protein mannosyltransferase